MGAGGPRARPQHARGQLDAGLRRAPLPVTLWARTASGFRVADLNDAACDFAGLPREELIGAKVATAGHDPARAGRDLLSALTAGAPVSRRFPRVLPTGEVREVEVVYVRRDDDEVLAYMLDVGARQRPREAERAEPGAARPGSAGFFDEAPVGMMLVAAGRLVRGHFIGANRSFCELLGYDGDEEIVDVDMLALTHPDDVEAERRLAQALFEGARSHYSLDKRFRRRDGSVAWTRFRMHALRDEHGAAIYGLGVAVDIQPEREAQLALADIAARTAALLGSLPDALVELDADGTVAGMNSAALLLFGLEPAAVAGRRLTSLIVPQASRAGVARLLGGGDLRTLRATLRRADGSEFPAELQLGATGVGEPPRRFLHVRSLAPQGRAEALLRTAEERFERLFRDGHAGALVIGLDGRVADVNPAFCRLAERAAPALLGADAAAVLPAVGEDGESPWVDAGSAGAAAAMRRILRPDGHAIAVQVTTILVRDAAGAPLHWLCQCTPRPPAQAEAQPPGEPLSYRERQVLGLLASGHAGPAIAERLGISSETVRSYAQSARNRLGAKTRTEAVALALVRGEISL